MADIQVVEAIVPGTGICRECGNGLWPGQEPCSHRSPEWLAAHAARQLALSERRQKTANASRRGRSEC